MTVNFLSSGSGCFIQPQAVGWFFSRLAARYSTERIADRLGMLRIDERKHRWLPLQSAARPEATPHLLSVSRALKSRETVGRGLWTRRGIDKYSPTSTNS